MQYILYGSRASGTAAVEIALGQCGVAYDVIARRRWSRFGARCVGRKHRDQ